MLDRPIFLVGHARGGTTALGAIINWHSHVGPKSQLMLECGHVGEFLSRTLDPKWHLGYSSSLEQKDTWFDFFPGEDVFTHMGDELIVEHCNLSDTQIYQLKKRLTENFKEKRFFSKAPSNTFRVKVIKEIFPDAKIVAILRRGESVISSWGERNYGFGKRVDWGETKINKLSYVRGICLFAKKWMQTLKYIESCKDDLDILTVSYESLTTRTDVILEKIFNKIELPIEPYIKEVDITCRENKWLNTIPFVYRPLLKSVVLKGNMIIKKM